MKILQVNKFFYLKGGAERYFFELSALLASRGHEVIPFAMEDRANFQTPYASHFVSHVDLDGSGSPLQRLKAAARVVYSFEARTKLARLLEITRPDVAHLHNIAHQISPSILGVLKRFGIPVVQTLHDYKLACPSYLMFVDGRLCDACVSGSPGNVILRRCVHGSVLQSALSCAERLVHRALRTFSEVDAFLCPSNFLLDVMKRAGIPKQKLFYAPHFLDLKPYLPLHESSDYFVYVGRLSEEKGLGALLEAKRKAKSLRLVVAGEGDIINRLRESLTAESGVSFVGFLPKERLADVWRHAAFTVVPSMCYENFPYAVLESFAFGKPVIASRIGGIPELIREGENGLLVEPGDSVELAARIEGLAGAPEEISRMGAVARSDVEKLYSVDSHYANIMGHYERIVR
jgi:glycosyltransferase involved in cell wall biosynthesis